MSEWKRPSDLLGKTLDGRYRVIRLMGQGGMGAVYEAEHVKLGGRVAVKVLNPLLAGQERERKRFLREARSAYRLKNEHVVRILDFGESPTVFFAMEMLDGQDLRELLVEGGALSWRDACEIVLQILEALEEAHAAGIVHRDLKPPNIFITTTGGRRTVKVLDFGIAKVIESTPLTTHVTLTNEIVGTVAYMAPEQGLGQPVDPRTDLYSLGVVFYELVTGQKPFSGSTMYEYIDQHVRATPQAPQERQPSVPDGVQSVILHALNKEMNHRFQSALEFATAIRAVLVAPGDIPFTLRAAKKPLDARLEMLDEREPSVSLDDASEVWNEEHGVGPTVVVPPLALTSTPTRRWETDSTDSPTSHFDPARGLIQRRWVMGVAALAIALITAGGVSTWSNLHEHRGAASTQKRAVPIIATHLRISSLQPKALPLAWAPAALKVSAASSATGETSEGTSGSSDWKPVVKPIHRTASSSRSPESPAQADRRRVASLKPELLQSCDLGSASIEVDVEISSQGTAYPDIIGADPSAQKCIYQHIRRTRFLSGLPRRVSFKLSR